MTVLFIHGNYPGQFRALAAELAARGTPVVFLAHPDTGQGWELSGVEVRRFAPHRAVGEGGHSYLHSSEQAVLEGQAVLRAVAGLLEEGLRPERVVFHGGLGYGLFLRSLLPGVPLIGYFEWYYRPETSRALLPVWDLDQQLRAELFNLPTLSEWHACDAAVTATDWQRQQFPAPLAQAMHVIHEGIPTAFFQPAEPPLGAVRLVGDLGAVELGAADLVLTYATRGMEPLRGFPEFLRAVPALLQRFPRLQVVMAGDDRVAYSYGAPSHGGSWKRHVLAELGDFPGRERLHFPGSLPYSAYRQLLQRSDLHCYLSRPFVPSWSLLEALACGCRLAINAGPATAIAAEAAFRQLDLEDPEGLAPALGEALAAIELQGLSRRGRVSLLPAGLELEPCLRQWLALLQTPWQSNG